MTWIENKQQKPTINKIVRVKTVYDQSYEDCKDNLGYWNGQVWNDEDNNFAAEDEEILFWQSLSLNETTLIDNANLTNGTTLVTKEDRVKDEVIKVLDWLSNSDSLMSILYGNQNERFADLEKDYTIEEVYQKYLNEKNESSKQID